MMKSDQDEIVFETNGGFEAEGKLPLTFCFFFTMASNCAHAQSHQSLLFMHTQSMEVEEDSDQRLDPR